MKRCTSRRPLIRLLVSSWLLAGAFGLVSYGQNGSSDTDPHATGYLPPTPEQERHVQETHPRIVKVWPNQFALARVNEERKKKGLEPLPEKGIVPKGAEKAFTIGNGPVISGVPQGFVGLAELASSQDNSLLDAFPEIRTQGSIGSCCPFSITYYQLTYTVGRLYAWNNKNVNNDMKFSPKWTYNMINRGEDRGSWPGDAYDVLEKHGAARWSLFPYQTSASDPKSYREWCRDGGTWQDAVNYRVYLVSFYCLGSDPFDTWLGQVKTLLANGEVLTFATHVLNWQFTTFENDAAVTEDDAFVGEWVAYWVNGTQGGHMMTIVGHNDSLWTDINNNRVVDAGEKGALKIANSWGPNWQDSGFCWLAYDALRAQSAVDGGPSTGREAAILEDSKVWSITVIRDYRPTLLAKFKLTHAKRDQLCVALAVFDGEARIPWTPGALQFQGGPYAFDGTTRACEGTFVFDFSDVLADASDSDLYELHVLDSTRRYPAELLGYKLTDVWRRVNGGLLSSPVVIDNDMLTAGLSYPSVEEHAPVAAASAQPASGRAPLAVTFDGRQSLDSGGDISSYVWDFGDGSPLGQGAVVKHTYNAAGTYTARLTVADRGWAESSDQVVITATRRK